MSFFKGYVRTRQKKCIDKFKNAPLKSFQEVADLDEYAGILDEDTVLIDIDNKEQAEKMLDIVEAMEVRCQVRKTTRGMHFYFKNDGNWDKCATHATLACGLTADVKVGRKASYAILKFGGVEREVIYDILEDETYQSPPVWMRLIHTNINLFDVGEGGGRNDKLFKIIMPMQESGLTKDEIVETLDVVNRFIFDKPLGKSEFETITRDEAFETSLIPNFFGKKGEFLFNEFAQYLVREHHIKRVNGALHLYRDGIYISDSKRLEREMIKLVPKLTDNNRKETLKYIEILCCDNHEISDCNYIAFNNGILDIDTMTIKPFNPDIVITNKISWDYNESAYNATVDKTFDKMACGDKEIRALLEEMAGYCFFRRNELRKAFVLTGDGSNGKSTYINMVSRMLGEENITALDMKDVGARFLTTQTFGKLANLGDDIGEGYIDDSSVFKKLVSGDKVLVENKYGDPFFFTNYAKFIFSANSMPRVRDRTQAVLGRLVIIPFNATFSVNDPDFDPFISDKLKERGAIEYLIKLGVAALKNVLARRAFTISDKVEKARQEYAEENNPALVFIKEWSEDDIVRESVAHWYARYGEHCIAYGCTPMSRIQFTKFLLKEFPNLEMKVVKIDGKSVRKLGAKS